MTLICGIPNAGKTTYSMQYKNVVHLDDYGHCLWTCLKKAVTFENPVIEGVYWGKKERKELINAKDWGNRACIWLDTPVDECVKRTGKSERCVRSYAQMFEPPTIDEGWDEIRIIRGEEVIVQSIDNQNKT